MPGGMIVGPTIKFQIATGDFKRSFRALDSQLKSNLNSINRTAAAHGKSLAETYFAPLLVKAGKLRALEAAGMKAPALVAKEHQKLAQALQTEVALTLRKHKLDSESLKWLKKGTLELERQKNAVAGLAPVTNRTMKAMEHGASAFSKTMKTALEEFRLRIGTEIPGLGFFRGFLPVGKEAETAAQGVEKSLGKVGIAAVATGGALGVLGTALGVLAVKGGHFAVQMANTAQATGLSVQRLIELRSAAKALEIEPDTLIRGFKRFATQVTYALGANAPGAGYEAVKAAELFKLLGVNIERASKDPMSAIHQLASAFQRVDTQATRVAIATELFGRGGQALIPILDELNGAVNGTAKSSAFLASQLGGNLKEQSEQWQRAMTNLANYTRGFEVLLANKVLPDLTAMLAKINSIAGATKGLYDRFAHPLRSPRAALEQAARASGLGQLSAQGREEFSKFVSGGFATGYVGREKFISESTIERLNQFRAYLVQAGKSTADAFEPLAPAIHRVNVELRKNIITGREVGAIISTESTGRHRAAHAAREQAKSVETLTKAIQRQTNALIEQLGIPAQNPYSTIRYRRVKTGRKMPPTIIPGLVTTNEANQMATKAKSVAASLHRQLIELTGSAVDKLNAQYQRDIANYKNMLDREQISHSQYIDLKAERDQLYFAQLEKLRQDDERKAEATAKRQADRIFAVLSGTSKNIGQAFAQMARSIALAPFQKVFENIFTGVFEHMNAALARIGGVFGNKNIARSPGIFPVPKSSGSWISKLGHAVGGLLGIKSPGESALGVGAMNVSAGTVYLNAAGIAGAGGALSLLSGKSGGLGSLVSQLFGGGKSGGGLGSLLTHVFGSSGSSSGGGLGSMLTQAFGGGSSLFSKLGGFFKSKGGLLLAGAGLLASSIFGGTGHTAGGALTGAAGGALTGLAFGGPIGAVIGGIGGALAGFFGHRDNTAGWLRHINTAMKRQHITLPPSEVFRFGEGANLAQTFSHTYSQSGTSFSLAGLKNNTPFWAHPIVGTPHGWRAQRQWNHIMSQFQSGLPFFGSGPNPFTSSQYGMPWGLFNLGPNGLEGGGNPLHWHSGLGFGPNLGIGSGGGGVTVHAPIELHVPGYVDETGLKKVADKIAPVIARHVVTEVTSASTGVGRMVRQQAWGRGF